MSLLARITGPTDLKTPPVAELPALTQEIRAFLIDTVSRVGGRLDPNLGTDGLTIAAHRVFDSPHDVLRVDTGHQTYTHKILTGRCAEFDSLRQPGGLSGYPSHAESGICWEALGQATAAGPGPPHNGRSWPSPRPNGRFRTERRTICLDSLHRWLMNAKDCWPTSLSSVWYCASPRTG